MTGISDEYITEAALVPALGASSAQKPESRFAALSRALNSGWGVACICFIVAIAAVVGMVAWGRMGEITTPGSDPTVRFAFSYEMTDNDGSAWSGTAMPGDIVNVSTTIVNHGKPFKAYDFFAFAQLVLQEDESVVIAGHYPVVDTDKHTVESGSTGSRTFHFHIPENAIPGVYDLVLSYDGEKQVFGGALTVGDPTEEFKPSYGTNDLYAFSFGYELAGDALTGTPYYMDTWVINEGEAFTYEGSSMGFAPSAVLIHMETQYRIEGMFDATTDYTEVTVNKGVVGRVNQEFFIPADAPTGAYALHLSYGGVFKSFPGVVIVAEPTVEDNTHIDPDELWEVAEQYISQVVENTDPAHYTRGSITTTMFTSGEYSICFGFHVNLLDMTTEETLHITLNGQGQYLSHEQDPQTYSLFIPYITTEMVEAAKPPLYEHPDVPLRLKHQYGYAIQDEDLYLTYTCYAEPEGNYETALECLYSTQVFLYPNPQTE